MSSAGQGAATARRVARRTVARSGGDGDGSRARRSAARRRSMDAWSVTHERTVMRAAHPVQRVTSTSKVRRKRVAHEERRRRHRRSGRDERRLGRGARVLLFLGRRRGASCLRFGRARHHARSPWVARRQTRERARHSTGDITRCLTRPRPTFFTRYTTWPSRRTPNRSRDGRQLLLQVDDNYFCRSIAVLTARARLRPGAPGCARST